MLKFIKHHVDSIWGIEIFPLIAFIIFFSFFVVLLFYVYSVKKSDWNEIAEMPLDETNYEPKKSNEL